MLSKSNKVKSFFFLPNSILHCNSDHIFPAAGQNYVASPRTYPWKTIEHPMLCFSKGSTWYLFAEWGSYTKMDKKNIPLED